MRPQPLRIAFATPEFVTEKYFDGGLSSYIHRVTKALAGMGHDIHVLTLSEFDKAEFHHEGVTVHRLPSGKRWSKSNHLAHYSLPNIIHLLAFSAKVYRKLKWLDSQKPLHLVQFPNYSCCGLVSMCCLGVPHVLRASSYQPALNEALGEKRTLDTRIVERLERLQFQLSRNIFAPSYALQQMLAKEARLTHVRVIRTPFYVETANWDNSVFDQFLQGRKYLLFFGRFQLHKGVHTLVQALPRFFEQYPDACVAIVGQDMASSLAPSMAEYARAGCSNYSDRLVLLEKLPHRQLYPVIAGVHLVALPSLIENLPNAGLEAMGLGKVVVGTAGTSFDELITEGVTGFLVPPNDAEALAEKIISAWTHPGLDEIGVAAWRKSLEFSPEKTVETLLNYYREILHG